MEDILNQGDDREPSRWPRRLGVIGAVLVVAVLGVVYLAQPHHPHSPAAAPTVSASAAEPTRIAGSDLPMAGSLRLPVAGSQPTWFSPASGVSARIGGLPADSAGYQFTRADGGWVVRAGSGGELASGDEEVPPLPVWFLGDGARSVTRVGTANQATPAATAGAVWLTNYPASADPATAARTTREVSVTGHPLTAPVRLPAGYAIYQATDRGLLLTPVTQRTGPQADRLWNPAHPKAARTFDAVLAASPTEIAWTPSCAAACHVEVLDLATGRQSSITLPSGGLAEGGAFSPTGSLLALQLMSDQSLSNQTGGPSTRLAVASTASGKVTVLPGTSVGSDTIVDFGWPTVGDSMIAEFIFPSAVQLASWHPGASMLTVAVISPGQLQASLVVG
jgi:hypothetical protein